jgi:Putative transposase DNA-binding domain
MSVHLPSSCPALLASPMSLWPMEADEPDEPAALTSLPGAGEGAETASKRRRRTKLSQTCQCGRVQKKPLSLRVHACPGCGLQMQRDLYSAYLIRFVDPKTLLLHADQAIKAWPGAESLLRAAWQQAHPTNQPASGGAYGSAHVRRRKAASRQSRSSAAGSPANSKSSEAVTARP